MNLSNIFNSFTKDMSEIIYNIEKHNNYIRCSKKRKLDELNYIVDESSIIYDSDSEDEDEYQYIDHKNYRVYKKYILK